MNEDFDKNFQPGMYISYQSSMSLVKKLELIFHADQGSKFEPQIMNQNGEFDISKIRSVIFTNRLK